MSLQERIDKDIATLAKKRDKENKILVQNLKYIKSECQLLLGKRVDKVLTDDEVLGILRIFIKNEEFNANRTGTTPDGMQYTLGWVKAYLPVSTKKVLTDDEIIAWIHQNIDFSTVPNKMAAMKPIMKGLSEYDVNGKHVQSLLEQM